MLRNEFIGSLARYTAKVVISEYWVVFFSNKICTFCAFYRPRANFFCSQWRSSRLWRDSRVILCDQKSVFTQFLTTWLLQHSLNVDDKKQNITFLLLLQHIGTNHSARICCKRQLLLHDFSSNKNWIFLVKKTFNLTEETS